MLTDNHTHCYFSGDSEAPVRDMADAAINAGLGGITFTDHCDPDFPLDPPDIFTFNFDDYFSELSRIKEEYATRLNIGIGLELGMRSDQKELLDGIAASKPFDYIIGSIHVVDGFDPYYPEYWQAKGTRNALMRYFEEASKCAKMFDFYDSFGHLDYIFRYVPENDRGYSWTDFRDLIDDILLTIIQKNKCLEINTAGLKYGLGYAHPTPDILRRYLELGGTKITLGSDAHAPAHVGYGFLETVQVLKDLGFSSYVRFEGRKEIIISFPDV